MNEEKAQKKREKYNAYYHAHKERIQEYRKESGLAHKSYLSYYEKNKEILRARNLARYYEKKLLAAQALSRQDRKTEQSDDLQAADLQDLEDTPAE